MKGLGKNKYNSSCIFDIIKKYFQFVKKNMANRNQQSSHSLGKHSFGPTQSKNFPQHISDIPSTSFSRPEESKMPVPMQEKHPLRQQGSPKMSPEKRQLKKEMNQDSEQSTKVSKKKVNKPYGLPNVGNSCCVNSVIQFLYACSKIRQTLIETACQIAKKYEELEKQILSETDRYQIKRRQKSFIQIIGTLFYWLKYDSQGNYSIKSKLLHELIDKLDRLDFGFLKYRQQDVLDIYNIVLEKVDEELPEQQSLSKLFQFSTQEKCKCKRPPLEIDHKYYVQRQMECSRCNSPFQKFIQGNPQYLIVLDIQDPKMPYWFNLKRYILKSRIAYSGNGHYGHYTCVREHEQTNFVFSDSFVYQDKEKTNFTYQNHVRKWNPYAPPNRMCLYALQGNYDVNNDRSEIEEKQRGTIQKCYQNEDILKAFIILLPIVTVLGFAWFIKSK